MTPGPTPRGHLDLGSPPRVEALTALTPAPPAARVWTRGRALAALLLLAPLLRLLLDTATQVLERTPTVWALLGVGATGAAATLATYLPRRWPPTRVRATAPCAASPLVLLALAWLMTGVAVTTWALVPVAVLGVGALVQRLATADTCAPAR
ncbi:hypothetical protein KMZ32_14235 [Phycicoccus sp. MAQZ13P-2]|uniref:hypothetical protein n=1 Tax=Phycicoccus mangrovi TaxID=2840470 RepID=UPI001BFFF6C4|nr:hypothetical protein [Phycicoccus mangrovi]MBT9255518.1 hypothetical protein [Phycicoccus mangrovi]MBT9275232.1 hypothetical protein [Phycicoccus mangrovi]